MVDPEKINGGDAAVFYVTLCLMRLHLDSVNTKEVP